MFPAFSLEPWCDLHLGFQDVERLASCVPQQIVPSRGSKSCRELGGSSSLPGNINGLYAVLILQVQLSCVRGLSEAAQDQLQDYLALVEAPSQACCVSWGLQNVCP